MSVATRVVAVLFSVGLIVAGLLGIAEIAFSSIQHHSLVIPWAGWYDNLRTVQWDRGGVRTVFAVVGAAGLVLIVMQLVRRGPTGIALTQDGTSTAPDNPARHDAWSIDRSSLQRALVQVAEGVDGVTKADCRITKDKAIVTAVTDRTRVDGLQDSVTDAVQAAVQSAATARLSPRVKIKRSPRSERRQSAQAVPA